MTHDRVVDERQPELAMVFVHVWLRHVLLSPPFLVVHESELVARRSSTGAYVRHYGEPFQGKPCWEALAFKVSFGEQWANR